MVVLRVFSDDPNPFRIPFFFLEYSAGVFTKILFLISWPGRSPLYSLESQGGGYSDLNPSPCPAYSARRFTRLLPSEVGTGTPPSASSLRQLSRFPACRGRTTLPFFVICCSLPTEVSLAKCFFNLHANADLPSLRNGVCSA